jgi:hypothetical protein
MDNHFRRGEGTADTSSVITVSKTGKRGKKEGYYFTQGSCSGEGDIPSSGLLLASFLGLRLKISYI